MRDGVAHRSVAVTASSNARVRAEVAARRWQSPLPSIVVMHNGPLTARQQIWVSLLAAPPGSVLGGLSAAEFDGLQGFSPSLTTVVAPGASRNAAQRVFDASEWPVALRWSTVLGDEDVCAGGSDPPRTRLARSIIDAASERVPDSRSRVLVLAAVQQKRTGPPALWDALSRRGRCRNRVVIAESIADAAGGIESLPEHQYSQILAARRLPKPSRQCPVQRRDGRYFLDNEWARFSVRAEIHGIPHLAVVHWDDDLTRQNALAIERAGLLIFSSYAVRRHPRRVGEQTEAMLRNHGWRG
jgi:hypothetical protein